LSEMSLDMVIVRFQGQQVFDKDAKRKEKYINGSKSELISAKPTYRDNSTR